MVSWMVFGWYWLLLAVLNGVGWYWYRRQWNSPSGQCLVCMVFIGWHVAMVMKSKDVVIHSLIPIHLPAGEKNCTSVSRCYMDTCSEHLFLACCANGLLAVYGASLCIKHAICYPDPSLQEASIYTTGVAISQPAGRIWLPQLPRLLCTITNSIREDLCPVGLNTHSIASVGNGCPDSFDSGCSYVNHKYVNQFKFHNHM